MAADWLLRWDRYRGEVEPAHLEAIAAGLTAMGWAGGGGTLHLTPHPTLDGAYLLGGSDPLTLTPAPGLPGAYLLGSPA